MRALDRVRSLWSRRLWRRLLLVAATLLVLSAVAGVVVGPVLRHVAERQLGRALGRRVAIGRVHVNPLALAVTVDRLEILEADGRTPFLGVRRLYVNVQLASLFRRVLVVREMRLESPRVRLERLQAPAGAWTGAAVYNISDIVTRLSADQPQRDAGLPRFSLNNLRITDGTLVFEDRPLHDRHEITGFTLGVPFLSTLPVDVDTFVAPGMSGRVDGRPFALEGRSKLFKDTIESVFQVRVNALDLTRYLSYLPVPLPVAVSSARLTVAADVSFVRPRGKAPRLSFKGKAELADVSLREPDREARALVELRQGIVAVGDADLTSRRFVIDQVLLSGLKVHARRARGGRLNVAPLLPGVASPPARGAPSPVEKPPQWSVAELRIEASTLALRDEDVQPPFEATVDELSLSVAHLSNTPGGEASVQVAWLASPGGRLTGQGKLGLEPLAANGTVAIDGIEPGRFAPYYRAQVPFGVTKGLLNIATRFELGDRGDHVALRLREGSLAAQELALRYPGARADFLRLPQFAARGVDVDLDRHAVSVGAINSRSGRLALARNQRGIVDVTTLAGSPRSSAVERAAAPPWAVSLERLDLEKWTVRFDDRAVRPPVSLVAAPLSLHATSLSTKPDRPGAVDLRFSLDKQARLALSGPVTLAPATANLRVDLRALDLVPLQPYWRDQVKPLATRGRLSFHGQVRIDEPPASASAPGNGPSSEARLRVTGDAELANLTAIDAEGKEELFRSRSFRLDGLKLSTQPFSLAVRAATLADFSAQLIVFPNGHFNVSRVLGPSKKAAPSAQAPPKISVGEVKLDGGQLRFSDRLIGPPTSIELTELTARVSGLSSGAGTRAEVDLRGRLDHSAPLSIGGKVNPLAKELFVDLRGVVKDFDLTAASAYAVHNLGYGIRKGKLSLDLGYRVAERKLDATNHVVVTGLRFGDKVPAPNASNLPVKLAVSLLEDRHGVIDLDLPISGALDDPRFAFWSQLGKALRTEVIEAATTAPFTLIAKAFGGPEELSRVEFPAGSASLDGKAMGKLGTLAKALAERSELAFEIQGGIDPARDREGLRRDPMMSHVEIGDAALRALAVRRATVVKEALAKLAPAAAGRLFVAKPFLSGGTSVEFKLRAE